MLRVLVPYSTVWASLFTLITDYWWYHVCLCLLSVSPSIVGIREENVTVVVNNFISLNCEATGLPPPTLSWFKDGRPVQASTNALIMPGTHAYWQIIEGLHSVHWIHITHKSLFLHSTSYSLSLSRWSYSPDPESKDVWRWEIQLCGHEPSRRSPKNYLSYSIWYVVCTVCTVFLVFYICLL